jgi:hypothetical protein
LISQLIIPSFARSTKVTFVFDGKKMQYTESRSQQIDWPVMSVEGEEGEVALRIIHFDWPTEESYEVKELSEG